MLAEIVVAVLIGWALLASAVLAALWVRLGHAEQEADRGWEAVNEVLEEIRDHLERLYRRTDVLPDGGVVEDE